MKKFFKEYFNFSKREQNGLFVLFGLILVLLGTNIVLSTQKASGKIDFSSYETEIDSFLVYQQTHFEDAELFAFDPNNASREDLLRLGLAPKSVNAILNYREKGYKFYKPEDLQRVRTLKPEEYETIKDYIVIEKKTYRRNYDNYERSNYNYEYPEKKTAELFKFDPNTATKEDFERLGFKTWQAENIIKFRNKGGVFKQADDIKKIYGLSEEFVNTLLPYIEISEIPAEVVPDILIDLNNASEEDLQNLPEIGVAYSKRIITYREKLGGFVSIEQLHEVYGITDELYNKIVKNIEVGNGKIKTININTADFKTLISHPYIDKEMTLAILNYREFAVEIKSIDELVKQKALTKEQFSKISKYISVK